MIHLLIYFLASFQITYTAILPSRSYNQINPQKPEGRLSLADSAEWTEYNLQEPEGPGTYSFGYDVEDPETGNVQFRTEERSSNGTVTGSYGYVASDGSVFVVHYIADHLGYRTKIEHARLTPQIDVFRKSNLSDDVNISPEMRAAIQSLQSKRGAKEEQHNRPKDQNGDKIVNDYEKKQQNIAYDAYFVPGLLN